MKYAAITVRRSLTLTKAFTPTTVAANATSRVTLTFNAAQQSDSVRMTDTLPAGLVIAPTPNVQMATVSGTCYASDAYYVATAGSTQFVITIGHTDSVGNSAYNQTLSEQRAAAVRSYLIAQGVDASRIQSKGHGETEPVATNETVGGRAQNRRVEIEVIRRDKP